MHDSWSIKVVQLYETTIVRHGIMMVGPAGTGKSRIIGCLQDALSSTMGIIHKRTRMNPKAIRAEEMFGETDKLSGEWLDGVFASMWAKFNDRNRKDIQWIICDGPVDAIWIENLNTVLDDNKILTLANGDRVPMTDNVKLLFEVEDLRNASPATVSRAGIIFVSESDLDWEPVLKSWLKKKSPHIGNVFEKCFTKYVGTCDGPKSYGHLFHYVQRTCKPVMTVSRVGMIEGCCNLLDALLTTSDLATAADELAIELERIFLYSLAWSVGGLLETDDRVIFTAYLCNICNNLSATAAAAAATASTGAHHGKDKDKDGSHGVHSAHAPPGAAAPAATHSHVHHSALPVMDHEKDTFFEFRVNTDSMEWERWVAPHWEYPHSIEDPDFSSMLVPTVETTRAAYILQQLHRLNKSAMMTGSSGTAKTSTALMLFDQIQNDLMRIKKVCFSSATSPFILQTTLELEFDKRGGKSFGPPGGKKMTVFMDDLSMPEMNNWGDQPTLEFVRQLVETSGFCFLDKDKRGDLKVIEDLQYIAAMGHPRGGRQDIPNRLKRHFFVFNLILPSAQAINEIYGQMMAGRFVGVPHFFHSIVHHLPNITVKLWNWMRTKMLPSPTKFHYTVSF
jgi:dynein heavy chain, axonemal